MDGLNSVLNATATAKSTNNGNSKIVVPFQRAEPVQDLSRTHKFLIKAGAVMATTSTNKDTGNAIKVNPTVVSLVVTLFGVLVVLGGFVYNYAVLSTQFDTEKKAREKLEQRIDNIEKIQREESLNKAKIDGYQIGKTEDKKK